MGTGELVSPEPLSLLISFNFGPDTKASLGNGLPVGGLPVHIRQGKARGHKESGERRAGEEFLCSSAVLGAGFFLQYRCPTEAVIAEASTSKMASTPKTLSPIHSLPATRLDKEQCSPIPYPLTKLLDFSNLGWFP